jgi:primosomal protein N' (replication factor Y) (superfamily II helicase)
MERLTLFAEILLPLPLAGTFTYRVPFEMNNDVIVGQRVVVQFGKKKIYTGLISSLHQKPPTTFEAKYILSILDTSPIVNSLQLKFWKWISTYYMSYEGEVMNAALPSSLKLASETTVILNENFDGNLDNLNEKEVLIAEALTHQEKLTISEVGEIAGLMKVIPLIKNLIEKGVILTEEEINDTFKPKKETYVDLAPEYLSDEEKLKTLFEELNKRAFKQLKILISLLSLKQKQKDVSRPELLKNAQASHAQLTALVQKGILQTEERTISRLAEFDRQESPESIQLTEAQTVAHGECQQAFVKNFPVLLHGITSSGKTEIYIKLIDEVLKQGKQVLYLLPEIALTTQIINRLRKYFGNTVGVYHSRYTKNEKVEIWNKVLKLDDSNNDQYQIVLGPRSALFLPFEKLGLIIIDEEHDSSFKQFDPAPRYNARDSAVYLASLHKASCILGSATPALESFFNAKKEKYQLVELKERFGGIQMPEIIVADIRHETRYKTMKSHFSSLLLSHIKAELLKKKQIILFQNRRGFSLRLECDVCGHIPQCKNCDVTLTYHKFHNHLRCHYCGWTTRIPEVCPACGNKSILMKGFGTEKVEDDLGILLPDTVIKRMDLDTTRKKHAYQQIINDFEQHKIDILVGTQMVTKGLDFDNVSLVGILNADNMLSYPDFRSLERSFQLMAQVSGRAGRKGTRGKVIIQTYNPQHQIIADVMRHDYMSMYHSQIQDRARFHYPPFYRLILIKLKHKDSRVLNEGATVFAQILKASFGKRILGPEYPLVSRIKNQYIKTVMIKLERSVSLAQMKTELYKKIDEFERLAQFKGIRLLIDVDPM